MRPQTDRQTHTHTQTDTHTDARDDNPTIHLASSTTHAKCNKCVEYDERLH